MFNICIEDFVKNPYFVLNTVAQADYYNNSFAEEFLSELTDGMKIIYDFYFQ